MTDSTHTEAPLGVLFMAYGGPESLEDMPGYLADIRAGRVTTQAVLDEITNNYRQIGGKSPCRNSPARRSRRPCRNSRRACSGP